MTMKQPKMWMFLLSPCAIFFTFLAVYDALQKRWALSCICWLFVIIPVGLVVYDYKQLKKLKAGTGQVKNIKGERA